MILQCYNCISLGLCQLKFILRCILKYKRFDCHFSYQSLLLGTKVLKDKSQLLCKLTLSTTLQTIVTFKKLSTLIPYHNAWFKTDIFHASFKAIHTYNTLHVCT